MLAGIPTLTLWWLTCRNDNDEAIGFGKAIASSLSWHVDFNNDDLAKTLNGVVDGYGFEPGEFNPDLVFIAYPVPTDNTCPSVVIGLGMFAEKFPCMSQKLQDSWLACIALDHYMFTYHDRSEWDTCTRYVTLSSLLSGEESP
jgi:hypothetical protein